MFKFIAWPEPHKYLMISFVGIPCIYNHLSFVITEMFVLLSIHKYVVFLRVSTIYSTDVVFIYQFRYMHTQEMQFLLHE